MMPSAPASRRRGMRSRTTSMLTTVSTESQASSRRGVLVGDDDRVGAHHLVDDAQAVGPDGGAGLGHFHDTVGQAFHHLGFRGAPGIEDVHVHAHALEVVAGQAFQLGGDALAGQVLRALVGGIAGHGQHPAAGAVMPTSRMPAAM